MTGRRLAGQAGFTLTEVLLAMSLMLVVFAASLSVFTTMERGSRDNQRLNDSQMQARQVTDAMAKRLRNLASPSDSTLAIDQQPLERAAAQDLVFRTVKSDGTPTTGNPQNLERYRFCLGSDQRVYQQRQTWDGATPAVPADTACPGAGWPETRVAASNVVNGTRPLFHYQGSPTPGTYTELTSVAPADFPTAIALRSTIYIDPDPDSAPRETTLTTRVFLRNQNRPPVADFTISATGRKITLNGSKSDDPEGNPLLYQWFDGNTALTDPVTGTTLPPSPNAVYTLTAAAGIHNYKLKVIDVGNLSASKGGGLAVCSLTSCTVTNP